MRVEDLSTYEIIEKRQIPDINSVTYLCRHKKTGARVALVSNDDENKVFYISDEVAQSQYINMFKEEGMNAVYLTHNIDNPYITHLEGKNENVKFLRIDADLADNFVGKKLTEEQTKEYTDKLSEAFKKATGNDKLVVKVESMKNENVSSVLTVSEESRRMMEMMRVYNMGGMDPNMFIQALMRNGQIGSAVEEVARSKGMLAGMRQVKFTVDGEPLDLSGFLGSEEAEAQAEEDESVAAAAAAAAVADNLTSDDGTDAE